MPNRARYALYYAPPADHPLTRLAANWLGRDVFSGVKLTRAEPLPPHWEPVIADPRHYGFHATLKPPMRLRPELQPWDLQSAVGAFCSKREPVTIGRLKVARIGHFFALVPEAAPADLAALADDVVRDFDRFRQPMGADEFARRNRPGLDATEVENLKAWGYPYVFERFRFHMSLTGPVPEDMRDEIGAHLTERFAAALRAPVTVDALTIFMEEIPGADFIAHSRNEFARSPVSQAG